MTSCHCKFTEHEVYFKKLKIKTKQNKQSKVKHKQQQQRQIMLLVIVPGVSKIVRCSTLLPSSEYLFRFEKVNE